MIRPFIGTTSFGLLYTLLAIVGLELFSANHCLGQQENKTGHRFLANQNAILVHL